MGSSTVKYSYPEVNKSLVEYVEREIMPRYAHFDKAHQEWHIREVMQKSQEISKNYDVDRNIIFAAASYHDLGIEFGRERHHLESGRIIREDANLKKWFSPEQIETIAQAAEDHRASSSKEPRTIYGKIIAEADRAIEPLTIIKRCVQFGIVNYPDLNRKEQRERTLSHINEKYGEGGYLKLWLPDSPNREPLRKLRGMVSDGKVFRKIFDECYRNEKLSPLVGERFLSDEKYRKNQIAVIAPVEGTEVLGLKVPQMKKIAKGISRREDWRETVADWKESAPVSPLCHEEKTMWGLVLDYAACPFDERKTLIKEFLKQIDNWAQCDTFCCNSSWVKKEDGDTVWKFVVKLMESRREFTRRAGIVLAMNHFLDEDSFRRTLETVDSLGLNEDDPYYVDMAAAWLLASSLAKYPDETRKFVSSSSLPDGIVKAYVRKARESLITRNVAAL